MSDSDSLTSDNSTTSSNTTNTTCTSNSSTTADSNTYSFVELQALSAVVGQIVTDACNYVSIFPVCITVTKTPFLYLCHISLISS